jgi:hypothetical protein
LAFREAKRFILDGNIYARMLQRFPDGSLAAGGGTAAGDRRERNPASGSARG